MEEDLSDSSNWIPVARIVQKLCKNGECEDDLIVEANDLIEGHVRAQCQQEDSESLTIGLDALKIMNRISADAVYDCLSIENVSKLPKIFQAAYGKTCSDVTTISKEVLTNFKSYSVETRIASYLQIWNCPTEDLIDFLTQAYADEKSLQFQNFIYSHIQARVTYRNIDTF